VAPSNGGLTVTGNGPSPAASGGRISRKIGPDGSTSQGFGILLNNTKDASFSWMELATFNNSAIAGRNVFGFLLADTVIDNAGTTAGIMEGPVMFGLPNPGGVNGLLGIGTIRNTVIQGGVEHNVAVYNQSGTMTLQIENTTGLPGGCRSGSTRNDRGHGLLVQLEGTATGRWTWAMLPEGNRSAGFLGTARDDSSLTVTVNASDVAGPGRVSGIMLSTRQRRANGDDYGQQFQVSPVVNSAGAGGRKCIGVVDAPRDDHQQPDRVGGIGYGTWYRGLLEQHGRRGVRDQAPGGLKPGHSVQPADRHPRR
jgi:hypothetical protein